MKNERPKPAWVTNLGLFGVIVADVVAYTGAGVFVGWVALEKLGWPWWVMLVTSITGLTLAMVKVYRISQLMK